MKWFLLVKNVRYTLVNYAGIGGYVRLVVLFGGGKRRYVMRNRVKCLQCGSELESKFRHDFQMCGCSNETFVDGGNDYTRIGGVKMSLIGIIREDGKVFAVTDELE